MYQQDQDGYCYRQHKKRRTRHHPPYLELGTQIANHKGNKIIRTSGKTQEIVRIDELHKNCPKHVAYYNKSQSQTSCKLKTLSIEQLKNDRHREYPEKHQ